MSTTELQVQNTAIMPMLAGVDFATLDTGKMEHLMTLQERWEDRQAEMALSSALAEFQAEVPHIPKNRTINRKSGPPTPYAGFEDIQGAIKPALARHGLSTSFDTRSAGSGELTAICTVRHRQGAKMASEFTVKVDTQLSANITQQYGSALTYAKRYALVAALSLIIGEPDDDGATAGMAPPVEVLTPEQVDDINYLLEKLPFGGKDEVPNLLAWAKVDRVEDIPARKYNLAIDGLKRKVEEANS